MCRGVVWPLVLSDFDIALDSLTTTVNLYFGSGIMVPETVSDWFLACHQSGAGFQTFTFESDLLGNVGRARSLHVLTSLTVCITTHETES